MNNLVKNVFITSTILLAASSSVAARYDSGMFARIDAGYGVSHRMGTYLNNGGYGPLEGNKLKNSNKSATFGVALGFQYSSEITFEISYLSLPKAKATIEGYSNSYELTSNALMASFVYYIPTTFAFRPFVSAGMGLGKAKLKSLTGTNSATNITNEGMLKRTGSAYQLSAGLSFPVSISTSVEVKYRYTALSGKPGGKEVGQRSMAHAGLFSLKMNF
jgi:opacity protein-like surface antigen